MSFSVTGLTAYNKQLIEPMLTSAVIGAKTQQMIYDGGIVIPKAKSVVQIPLIDTSVSFATQSCAWDPTDSTSFTQATITVGKIKVEESLCLKTLEAYFLQEAIKQGSELDENSAPAIMEKYLAKKSARIAAQLETAIWQGATDYTGTGSGNLNKFDGFSKLIQAGSPVNANATGYLGTTATISTVTQSNVITATEAIYKALPAEVATKSDCKIFVGYDWFRLLVSAYRALNMFSYNPQDANMQGFILPSTNIEVVPVNGLNGTGDAFALSLSNMALAVDLENEEQNYQLWYNMNDNDVRFRCQFKVGVGVPFTAETVKFIAAI